MKFAIFVMALGVFFLSNNVMLAGKRSRSSSEAYSPRTVSSDEEIAQYQLPSIEPMPLRGYGSFQWYQQQFDNALSVVLAEFSKVINVETAEISREVRQLEATQEDGLVYVKNISTACPATEFFRKHIPDRVIQVKWIREGEEGIAGNRVHINQTMFQALSEQDKEAYLHNLKHHILKGTSYYLAVLNQMIQSRKSCSSSLAQSLVDDYYTLSKNRAMVLTVCGHESFFIPGNWQGESCMQELKSALTRVAGESIEGLSNERLRGLQREDDEKIKFGEDAHAFNQRVKKLQIKK